MPEEVTSAAQDTTNAAVTEKTGSEAKVVETPAKVDETNPATEKPRESEAEPTEGEKPAAVAKPVPEKYELKLAEGSLLDAAHLEKVSAFAKENGFSNELAQKVLEREDTLLRDHLKSHSPGGEAWNAKLDEWEKASLSDKEIGGSKETLKANTDRAAKVIQKYFPETVSKFLQDSGFGSHPGVLKGFIRMGKEMADDDLVLPESMAGEELAPEDILYKKTK